VSSLFIARGSSNNPRRGRELQVQELPRIQHGFKSHSLSGGDREEKEEGEEGGETAAVGGSN